MIDNYEMLAESQIPKCCGSCSLIRYCKDAVGSYRICHLTNDKICIFGKCPKYKPSKLIF